MEKKLPKEPFIGVCELGNYQMLIKGSSKVLISNSYNYVDSLRMSSKKPSQNLSICIYSFRIRSFLNEIVPIQCEEIFSFIYERAKNGGDTLWTIETVI